MVSRGDSAAGLAMLGAVKGKLAYGDDFGHEAAPQQQHDTHHSHQRMCLLPAEIYDHVVDGGAHQTMQKALLCWIVAHSAEGIDADTDGSVWCLWCLVCVAVCLH